MYSLLKDVGPRDLRSNFITLSFHKNAGHSSTGCLLTHKMCWGGDYIYPPSIHMHTPNACIICANKNIGQTISLIARITNNYIIISHLFNVHVFFKSEILDSIHCLVYNYARYN